MSTMMYRESIFMQTSVKDLKIALLNLTSAAMNFACLIATVELSPCLQTAIVKFWEMEQ
jgi:hypothetical protein